MSRQIELLRKLKLSFLLPKEVQDLLTEIMYDSDKLEMIAEYGSDKTTLRIYTWSNLADIMEHSNDFPERDVMSLELADIYMTYIPGIANRAGVIHVCQKGLESVLSDKTSSSFRYCGTAEDFVKETVNDEEGTICLQNKDMHIVIKLNDKSYASVNVRFWCD